MKSKIIQEGFWSDISPMSESIETSETWTGLGTRGSVLSQQESRANRSVVQGSKEARRMTVGSGRKCVELLSKRNPLTSLLKMLLVSSIWHSTRSVLTWKPKTTPRGRLYLELQVSMPRTEGNESGVSPNVWATPNASDSYNPNMKDDHDLKKGYLRGQVQMWPTPSTRDHKGGYQGGRIRNGRVSMDTLDVAVQATSNQEKTQASLNPTWVEGLMGYPKGWTCLDDGETEPGRKECRE